jgi:N6-adenosine-specific RNA methylase IME4
MVTQNALLGGKPDPAGTFKTILADPPWDVEQRGALGAISHYKLMSLDAIKKMPVSDLAAPDAHCWLWVTNATLRAGYDVMEAWGFTPRSPLTWIKPRIGLGQYLRNATEHLILGTRGTAPVKFRAQPTWMFAPLQEHSHKPGLCAKKCAKTLQRSKGHGIEEIYNNHLIKEGSIPWLQPSIQPEHGRSHHW